VLQFLTFYLQMILSFLQKRLPQRRFISSLVWSYITIGLDNQSISPNHQFISIRIPPLQLLIVLVAFFHSKEPQFPPNIWVYLFLLAKLNLQRLKIYWRKFQGKLRYGVQKPYLKLGALFLLNQWLQLFPLMP
jgi:hypothetical protein